MMTPSEMLSRAIHIMGAEFVHKMDRGGIPYALHCLAVMNGVSSLGHEVMAAAVLHDLFEDTDKDEKYLRAYGFSDKCINMIKMCTRSPNEDYLTYIGRVSTTKETRAIKLADLRHNMDPSRLPDLSEKTMERMKKYHTAYSILMKDKRYDEN